MSLLIYFTNWSWLFQAVFYTIDYIGRVLLLFGLKSGYALRYAMTFLFFWFINGTVWLVLILVTIIIQQNPQLLITTAMQMGDINQTLGEVVNGHILIHYVPGFMAFVFLVLERHIIGQTIIDFYMILRYNQIYAALCNGLYIFYTTVVTVAIPFVVYCIVFDPRQIYGISTSIAVLVLVSLAVIFIFNVIPFLMMLQKYVYKRRLPRVHRRFYDE